MVSVVLRRVCAAAAVLVAAVVLAGCGSAGSSGGAAPFPGGSWPAADQNAFLAACSPFGGSTYCACALGDDMQKHPDASSLAGSFASRGRAAATHERRFPDCASL